MEGMVASRGDVVFHSASTLEDQENAHITQDVITVQAAGIASDKRVHGTLIRQIFLLQKF